MVYQPPTAEHLADLIATLRRDYDDLRSEIDGPLIGTTRLPLRDRVHILEGAEAAKSAAESALAAMRAKNDVRQMRRYGRAFALAGLAVTIINVGLGYLLH